MNNETNTNTVETSKRFSRAVLVAKYHGATNTLGARISVSSQHALGRKSYSWDYALNVAENYQKAADLYLKRIEQINGLRDGCMGWGRINEFAHGVLSDGTHVFCFVN